MKYLLPLFAILLALSSCNTAPITNPTIERIENVNVEEFNTKLISGTAEMVLKNPNAFSLDLAEADLVAIVDDLELATIKQTYDTKMPANSEFKMPIKLEVGLQKMYDKDPMDAYKKGMKMYLDREITIKFKGTIKVGHGSAKISIPVDQEELIKF